MQFPNQWVSFSASELPFTVKAIAVASNYDNSEIATLEIVEGLTLDDDDYYIIASDDDFKKFITMADGTGFEISNELFHLIKDITNVKDLHGMLMRIGAYSIVLCLTLFKTSSISKAIFNAR